MMTTSMFCAAELGRAQDRACVVAEQFLDLGVADDVKLRYAALGWTPVRLATAAVLRNAQTASRRETSMAVAPGSPLVASRPDLASMASLAWNLVAWVCSGGKLGVRRTGVNARFGHERYDPRV